MDWRDEYLRPYAHTLSQTLNAGTMSSPRPRYTIPVSLSPEHDSDDRRTFDIAQGDRIIIGRSSSRTDAKNLQAAANNALFDCPVVSRQHAELQMHPYKPRSEQITITDRESMHGTYVNESRLEPYKPVTLRSGDSIKLGDKVTRGSDTHDGIRLVFHRRDAPIPVTSTSTATGTRFIVPSESEDESDVADDARSIISIEEDVDPTTSAQTTPEQPNAMLGSQKQPIDVEQPKTVTNIIDLVDDEDIAPASRKVPTFINKTYTGPVPIAPKVTGALQGPKKVIQDIYDEDEIESVMVRNTGLSQILNNEPGDDEDEDEIEAPEDDDFEDDLSQDLDNLSESDASDLSNHDLDSREASDDEDENERPEIMSSKRLASEELGESGESERVRETLLVSPTAETAAPSSSVYGWPQAQQQLQVCNMSHAPHRYDPIRSLNDAAPPPPLPIGWQPPSAYTYGDSQGSSFGARPATDRLASSRWDVGPAPVTNAYDPMPYYTAVPPAPVRYAPPPPPPVPFTAATAPHAPFAPASSYRPGASWMPFSQIPISPVNPAIHERVSTSYRESVQKAQPEAEATKSRISITSITDNEPTALKSPLQSQSGATNEEDMDVEISSTVQEPSSTLASPLLPVSDVPTTGTKRKADAISADDEVADMIAVVNEIGCTYSLPRDSAEDPEVLRVAKKARTTMATSTSVLGAAKSVAKYAAVATAGGVGMVVFLASPWAEIVLGRL